MFLFGITHRSWGLPGVILVVAGAIAFFLQYFLIQRVEKWVLRFFMKLFPLSEEGAAKIVLIIMVLISFGVGFAATFSFSGFFYKIGG